jgi:hypothetical protein
MASLSRRVFSLAFVAAVACSQAPDDGEVDTSASPSAVVSNSCRTNDDCNRVDYCQAPVGQCGLGTCAGRGINLFCMSTEVPVCGCDGVTYTNRCWSNKAGASLAHEGACASEPANVGAFPFVSRYLLEAYGLR